MLQEFKILEKLGKGSYGTVYKVMRYQDEQNYALKKVNVNRLSKPEKMNALNEVRIIASIRSPYIVNFKECFIDKQSDQLCIIMEFLDNGDLHQQIANRVRAKQKFSEQEIWNAFFQISRGLKVLHDLQIVHRDLKSANVFVNKDGSMRLGDFNVSKVQTQDFLYSQTGTPSYSSPEMWNKLPYDHKTDIWSLGCIIYEMCTLQTPFHSNNVQTSYNNIQQGIYKPISKEFSYELREIIDKCLKVSCNQRPSINEIVNNQKILKKFRLKTIQEQDLKENTELLNLIKLPYSSRSLSSQKLRLPDQNYLPLQQKSMNFQLQDPKIDNKPVEQNNADKNLQQNQKKQTKENLRYSSQNNNGKTNSEILKQQQSKQLIINLQSNKIQKYNSVNNIMQTSQQKKLQYIQEEIQSNNQSQSQQSIPLTNHSEYQSPSLKDLIESKSNQIYGPYRKKQNSVSQQQSQPYANSINNNLSDIQQQNSSNKRYYISPKPMQVKKSVSQTQNLKSILSSREYKQATQQNNLSNISKNNNNVSIKLNTSKSVILDKQQDDNNNAQNNKKNKDKSEIQDRLDVILENKQKQYSKNIEQIKEKKNSPQMKISSEKIIQAKKQAQTQRNIQSKSQNYSLFSQNKQNNNNISISSREQYTSNNSKQKLLQKNDKGYVMLSERVKTDINENNKSVQQQQYKSYDYYNYNGFKKQMNKMFLEKLDKQKQLKQQQQKKDIEQNINPSQKQDKQFEQKEINDKQKTISQQELISPISPYKLQKKQQLQNIKQNQKSLQQQQKNNDNNTNNKNLNQSQIYDQIKQKLITQQSTNNNSTILMSNSKKSTMSQSHNSIKYNQQIQQQQKKKYLQQKKKQLYNPIYSQSIDLTKQRNSQPSSSMFLEKNQLLSQSVSIQLQNQQQKQQQSIQKKPIVSTTNILKSPQQSLPQKKKTLTPDRYSKQKLTSTRNINTSSNNDILSLIQRNLTSKKKISSITKALKTPATSTSTEMVSINKLVKKNNQQVYNSNRKM